VFPADRSSHSSTGAINITQLLATVRLPGLEEDDGVASKKEAALILGVVERTVDRILKARELPFVQISPRRVGILKSDARDYLRARRQWRPEQSTLREPAQSERV
jgi:hypothetical protein